MKKFISLLLLSTILGGCCCHRDCSNCTTQDNVTEKMQHEHLAK